MRAHFCPKAHCVTLLNPQITLIPKRCAMVIGETTVRPMDETVEHPRMDLLRVDE